MFAADGVRARVPIAHRPPVRGDRNPTHPFSVVSAGADHMLRGWDAATGQATGFAAGKMLADIDGATSATTLTLPNGEAAVAVGHTDGSLTVTATS